MLFKSFDDPEFDNAWEKKIRENTWEDSMGLAQEEAGFFDPQVNTVAICDWTTFEGDTIKEKYEGVYVKLVELKNILKAKAKAAGLETGDFIITAGEFFADLMECSRTYCFGGHPDRSVEVPLIGEFIISDDHVKVYWGKTMSRNKVLLHCDNGKGLLIINNIPQPEDNAIDKPAQSS